MECIDFDEVKPLDELLDDTIREFDSGRDRDCDRDIDRMILKLGDYENEESPHEAEDYLEDTPIEDELVEKRMIVGRKGRTSFREVPETEESFFTGGQLATASSIGPESRRNKTKAAGSRTSGKKKK